MIRYLSLLLNHEMPLKERQEQLEQDYHIQMSEELKEDVGKMCNYSDAILRMGEEKGKMETLIDLVRKKILSVKDAAAQADMTIAEFCKKAGLPVQQ